MRGDLATVAQDHMFGDPRLPADETSGSQNHRTRQSRLAREDRSSSDPGVVPHLDLGVKSNTLTQKSRIEQARTHLALGPDPNIRFDDHPGPMRQRQKPSTPFDHPESGGTQDCAFSYATSLSHSNAGMEDHPRPDPGSFTNHG